MDVGVAGRAQRTRRPGAAEVPALAVVDAQGEQRRGVLRGLDALRDDLRARAVAEIGKRPGSCSESSSSTRSNGRRRSNRGQSSDSRVIVDTFIATYPEPNANCSAARSRATNSKRSRYPIEWASANHTSGVDDENRLSASAPTRAPDASATIGWRTIVGPPAANTPGPAARRSKHAGWPPGSAAR